MQEFENGLEKKWEFERAPFDSIVKIADLKKFLKPTDTLIFYGGEPLIRLEKIKEIIDTIPCRFCMQTNAKLLHTLPTKYLVALDKILVSIDGDKMRTDENKGAGTYELVIKNVKDARARGFSGEIVARMVITKPDVYEQVKHLLDLSIFDSVHFQIDAGFYKNDFHKEKFTRFVEEYNTNLTKLINFWLSEIKKGKVHMIYPFLGIFDSIFHNKKTKLRCGAGHKNFTITTKGDLSACPIMNSTKTFYCGSLKDGIRKEMHVGAPCTNCEHLDLCGGRCLYANHAQLWPKVGQDLICKTIIHLINEIQRITPEIKKEINKSTVHNLDFGFEKYFGPEIVP